MVLLYNSSMVITKLVSEPKVDCTECGGSGGIEGLGSFVPCTTCDGSGKLPVSVAHSPGQFFVWYKRAIDQISNFSFCGMNTYEEAEEFMLDKLDRGQGDGIESVYSLREAAIDFIPLGTSELVRK